MTIAKRILELAEQLEKTYKGIDYTIEKKGKQFQAEIEREEIEGTKSNTQKSTDKKAKDYIDKVV